MIIRDTNATAFDAFATSNRQHRSLAFPVSQISIDIGQAEASLVQDEVLRWIARRAGRSLPDKAWQGEAFQLEEIGAQHAEVCKLVSPHFWAARLDDADKTVPSRTWVTEAALAVRDGGSIIFGARLTAVVRNSETSYERSISGFVRQIVAKFKTSLDGVRIAETPWFVSTSAEVNRLFILLLDQNRIVDVIVISTAENTEDASTVIVDAFDLAKRLTAAAHVIVISSEASFAFSDMIGREFSVFRQGVRTYKPKFNPDYDEPFAHPLGLPQKILNWPNGGAAGYAKHIASQALIRTVSSPDLERSVPSFLKVKSAATELRFEAAKNAGSSDADLISLYEKDNEDLRSQLAQLNETSDALLLLAENERSSALETVHQARETIKHLQRRIANLSAEKTPEIDAHIAYPPDLENIQEWCSINLAGSV